MSRANNNLIAHNAMALTLRMVLVTIVGLYTSRIVLAQLGVESYGVYGLVCGFIALFKFINTSLANATLRSITVSLRSEEPVRRHVFATAMRLHFVAGGAVAVISAVAGRLMLDNVLVIPSGSIGAATFVLNCLCVVMFLSILQIPFTSMMIAREDMKIYAVVETVNTVIKLAAVTSLIFINGNKLEAYALLSIAMSVISFVIYCVYCNRRYSNSTALTGWDRPTARRLSALAGNDMFRTAGNLARESGDPLILNVFFGVVVNTATTIITTVLNSITMLVTTIISAFQPQIIKSYADGDHGEMSALMRRATVFTLLAYSALAIPVIIATPAVLELWLGQVPPFTVDFLRLVLALNIAWLVNRVIEISVIATGRVKPFSRWCGALYFLCPPLSLLVLSLGAPASTVFIIEGIIITGVAATGLYFIKLNIPDFDIAAYLSSTLRGIGAVGLTALAAWGVTSLLPETIMVGSAVGGQLPSIVTAVLITLTALVPVTIVTLNPSDRATLIAGLGTVINRLNKGS